MKSRIALSRLLLCAALCSIGASATHAQLPYGPDTCKQGFVWREAFPGDHVCVTPEARARAAQDNRAAHARRQPGGGAYGPATCRQGFVWREARPGDVVCVTPATRAEAAADNRQAVNRRAVQHAPAPAPVTSPPIQVRREDERCYQYANGAMRQYRMATQRAGCGVGMSGRWQPNYESHYQWCLSASNAALASEQEARNAHLLRCGAVVRID